LSTGSILLIVAFLEKVFSKPLWKPLVAISVICFALSIVACVLTQTIYMANYHLLAEERTRSQKIFLNGGIILCWVGFLSGIILLTIFAVRNLLQ
jgi:hypothetical protein